MLNLGTKRQYQNANAQNPNTKYAPQTQKSVAFHTLAFCLWQSDRIPVMLRLTHLRIIRWVAGWCSGKVFFYFVIQYG